MQDEFSHTVLHGENIKKKLQVQNNAVAKPSAKPLNVPVFNILANPHPRPIYDPAKIYGQPQFLSKKPNLCVQKSQDKKCFELKRRQPSVEKPLVIYFVILFIMAEWIILNLYFLDKRLIS